MFESSLRLSADLRFKRTLSGELALYYDAERVLVWDLLRLRDRVAQDGVSKVIARFLSQIVSASKAVEIALEIRPALLLLPSARPGLHRPSQVRVVRVEIRRSKAGEAHNNLANQKGHGDAKASEHDVEREPPTIAPADHFRLRGGRYRSRSRAGHGFSASPSREAVK